MVILFGTSDRTSTLETGTFYCPDCRRPTTYRLLQVRTYFTLFFLPLVPLQRGPRYVACRRCGGKFHEAVFDQEPLDIPVNSGGLSSLTRQANRLLARVEHELQSGTSLDDARRLLENEGMERAEAEDWVKNLCDYLTRDCKCGRRYHPNVRHCRHCGARL